MLSNTFESQVKLKGVRVIDSPKHPVGASASEIKKKLQQVCFQFPSYIFKYIFFIYLVHVLSYCDILDRCYPVLDQCPKRSANGYLRKIQKVTERLNVFSIYAAKNINYNIFRFKRILFSPPHRLLKELGFLHCFHRCFS